MLNRSRLGFLAAGLAAVLLGCGGGNEQTGATDLYGVYEVIDKGMSLTQLKALVGAEPSRSQPDGEQRQILSRETDPNTYRHISLMVTVHAEDGATRKIVIGYRGNKSQAF